MAADICTPAFETECMIETILTKKIVEVDFCFTFNKTVCSITTESIDNEICTFEYSRKEEASTAQTVQVQFEKKCRKQKVTVCDYAGYHQVTLHSGLRFTLGKIKMTSCNLDGVRGVYLLLCWFNGGGGVGKGSI